MNLPNLITLGRMLLAPLVVWLLIGGNHVAALAAFCLASASDGLDGWLARWLDQKTELGAHLDPLADKLLLVCSYATMGMMKLLPPWLVITVISRDVLILGGLLLARFMAKPVAVKPLMISKANTLAQILFLILALSQLALGLAVTPWLEAAAAVFVVVMAVLSGLAYVRLWLGHMAMGEA